MCKPKVPEPSVEWHFIHAKYPGQCRGCNLPIPVGALIAYARDQPIYHEGCQP